MKRIKSHKKIALNESRIESSRSLTMDELKQWLEACEAEYKAGELELKDYVLFLVTFFLSDRKSETYALKWKILILRTHKSPLKQHLISSASLRVPRLIKPRYSRYQRN